MSRTVPVNLHVKILVLTNNTHTIQNPSGSAAVGCVAPEGASIVSLGSDEC
jgi:hypothetical protein